MTYLYVFQEKRVSINVYTTILHIYIHGEGEGEGQKERNKYVKILTMSAFQCFIDCFNSLPTFNRSQTVSKSLNSLQPCYPQ